MASWVMWPPEHEMHGGAGRTGEGRSALRAPPINPITPPQILIPRAQASGQRLSALLNFIIFIKLIYRSQCGHLIKTFPRALCRLLNEAGAAGLRFRVSWGEEGGRCQDVT